MAHGEEHAFLYSSGGMSDLGTLDGSNSEARGLNAGDALEIRQQLFLQLSDSLAVFAPRRAHMKGNGVARIESKIDVREIVVTAQHESGAG